MDVEAVVGEIEVGRVGSSLSWRSENLFEEGCIACDDCGNNVDVRVRPEGGMVVRTVSRMAVGVNTIVSPSCAIGVSVVMWERKFDTGF